METTNACLLPLRDERQHRDFFPACIQLQQECMLFVCEVEKKGNVIYVGVFVAGNFFLVEGQALLRSSGIDAARIWYIVILDFVFVSC